jgi:truncated hemoglobin YjbI
MTICSDTVAPAEATSVNVYQAIGGRAAVAAAVEGLYGRILADPVLSRFFPRGVAARHRAYVVTVLGEAIGGPELFQRDPSLRPLFTTDMGEQRVKFAQKLTEIVRTIPRIGELLSHTRALGARHVGYGVRAADYQTVGDSLIAALAGVLGEEFDAATREAWVLAFNIVAETMLEGAASARLIGS